MSPILQARLLGEFSLTCDGCPVTTPLTRRSQALLAYLLLNRHTRQLRQRLAFHLWSESIESQAQTNLRILSEQLAAEREAIAKSANSLEEREGLAVFLQKQHPVYV